MIRRNFMNNKHQENGALRGPLIFTLPASSFVVILIFDWLDGTDRAAVSAKTHGWNYLATRPRTAKEFASGVLNEGREWPSSCPLDGAEVFQQGEIDSI